MATINKIDLNGDTYDIESSGLVTTQPTNPSEGATYYDTTNDVVKVYDGTNWVEVGSGSGDVVGPNSSTNGHVAVFDGTTGKAIKDGGAVPRIINVTVTTAATTPDKVGTTTEGNYTPTAGDLLLVNFVNGCGVASPTLNIDGTGAKYIRTGNQIASTSTFALGTIADSNIKALLYYDGEFYRCWSTSNATYSTLPVAEGKTGTSTNSRTISAANLKEIIKYHAVSDTAYGSTWDGVTDIAPSENAVYDKIESLNLPIVSSTAPATPTEGMIWYDTTNDLLKTYDGSNWNVTGKEYNAGTGIEIKNLPDYSALQGPAPDGFHVPLNTEWQAVYDIWTALGGGSTDGTNFGIALKLPFAGHRSYSSASVNYQGSYGRYWSSSRYDASNANNLYIGSSTLTPQSSYFRTLGFSVRCFKDSPIVPTSSWTKLYGTSIEAGGIFWSSADGLISLSSDGTNWITIADKNLGATTVWNSGDTLSEANCGKYYQRGNNYGFPRTGSVTTSGTQVDASTYGPGNYYSSSTFITRSGSPFRRDSTDNGNLWGGVTGVVTLENAITNTGVLSVNGQTGDVTIPTAEESNTKTFPISSTSDLTTAQAVLNWCLAQKNPIIVYSGKTYIIREFTGSVIEFASVESITVASSITSLKTSRLKINYSGTTVSSISVNDTTTPVLQTNQNYSTPYTPTYAGSPATKKYVDDNDTVKSGDSGTTYTIKVSNSAPASGTPNSTITFVI